jgi:uncharacterized protein (DUF433 family)
MKSEIYIIDRGRGPQLSTSRITVQDLVPYFQKHFTHEQIQEIIPVLTVEEIQAVERYVQDHYESVMEQDRRIRERSASRRDPPEVAEILRRGGEKMAALREEFQKRKQRREAKGDHVGG